MLVKITIVFADVEAVVVVVEAGYYSNRIDELEQRKNEVLGKLTTDKLTLKSIEKEMAKCSEAMQKLGNPIHKELSLKGKEIAKLTDILVEKDSEIDLLNDTVAKTNELNLKLGDRINRLREVNKKIQFENKTLKYTLTKAERRIAFLEERLVSSNQMRDDVILADNFGEVNIFDEIRSE